jgi:hypothetical protein
MRLVHQGLFQLLVIMLLIRGTMAACTFTGLPSASLLVVPATTGTGFQSIVVDATMLIDAGCSGLYSGFKLVNSADNSDYTDAASLYINGGTNGVMQSVDTVVV